VEHRFAIGIDVGTSSVKGTLIADDGSTDTRRSQPYPTSSPTPKATEQNPDDWWRAVGDVLEQLVADHPQIGARTTTVGLTGQMHTSVLRDAGGDLIRPAILWSDQRGTRQCEDITRRVPDIAAITGNPLLPAFTLVHLSWLAQHEPGAFTAIASVAAPKDDIRRRLGAGTVTEPSDASGTSLLDFRTDAWSPRIAAAIGLPLGVLPPVRPSHEVTGVITRAPTTTLDQLLGIEVVSGAGDQAAQAVALEVTSAGRLGFSLGTSGVAFQSLDQPRQGSFRHAYPHRWLALDSTHAAGLALSWWSGMTGRPVQELALGSNNPEAAPIFLPFLQGHRSAAGPPGALIGLDIRHTSADIGYAVMEGVTFEMVRLAESVGDGDVADGQVHLGGGGGASPRWRQLLADALQRTVVYTDRDSSFGAALLAAESAGWAERFRAADQSPTVLTDPGDGSQRTRRRLARYRDLTARLS